MEVQKTSYMIDTRGEGYGAVQKMKKVSLSARILYLFSITVTLSTEK